MSQGFLLFAHDNEEIDYALLAAWCARRINVYLDKPVSLVTDQATATRLGKNKRYFDQIILSDIPRHQKRRYHDRFLNFNNYDRCHAWDLTPYEETMVIDTDIVIQSTAMNRVWGSDHHLMVCAKSIDAYTNKVESEFEYLDETSIKFFWATQIYFRKNQETEIFFKTCKWVRSNYVWLSRVYGIDHRLLRNDYVWSIAIHMLNQTEYLPWTLLHTTYRTRLHSMQNNQVIIYQPDLMVKKVVDHDIHVMHKDDLIRLATVELEQYND